MKNQNLTVLPLIAACGLLLGAGIHAAFADFTIAATPVVSSGSNSICPGGFAGYALYSKTVAQGWGWAPTNTVHTATDTNRSDTKVEFTGKSGDTGCNQTTVTVPHPTTSTKYRFKVYFPDNVPTNSYNLTLSGFIP
ncbi:MAG: hypothetical protein NTZ16_11635 [Verrucomicrobia bacterium]|nr:hypothetical protein [Verrucomicrobiota bacterium]